MIPSTPVINSNEQRGIASDMVARAGAQLRAAKDILEDSAVTTVSPGHDFISVSQDRAGALNNSLKYAANDAESMAISFEGTAHDTLATKWALEVNRLSGFLDGVLHGRTAPGPLMVPEKASAALQGALSGLRALDDAAQGMPASD